MNNQALRIGVIIGGILPFAMLGYKLYEQESIVTAGLYTAVVVILFATVIAGLRTAPASPPPPRSDRADRA